jgi:hypothetical protein
VKKLVSMCIGATATLLLSGCGAIPDVHVAPDGNWTAQRVAGNAATCSFPWLIEVEYRDGKIIYTEPQASGGWITSLSDLDSTSPGSLSRTSQALSSLTSRSDEHLIECPWSEDLTIRSLLTQLIWRLGWQSTLSTVQHS